MATIDYPVELPAPTRENYGHQHTSPFARTEMSTGRARQRRTFQSVPTATTLRWVFREPEAQIFEAWFKYDIQDGADWFNIDLRTPIGILAPYECRFMQMYEGPVLFGTEGWAITAELEIRERPILSQDWYSIGKPFILQSDVIDYAINQEYPSFDTQGVYATYAAAQADFSNQVDGQMVVIEKDETQGGARTSYRVVRNTDGSLLLNFVMNNYYIAEPDGLYLL